LTSVPDVLSQTNYGFRPFVALPLTTATLMLLLGIILLARERASHISRLFFATACSIAAWLFAFSLMYATTDARIAFFWGKAAFLAIPFIPTAVFHFVVGLERTERRLQTALRAMWAVSAAFALLIVTTNQIVDGMEHYPWGFYPRYGWASGPYLLFFFFGLGSALYHSIHTWKTAESDVERRRMAWISLALIVGYTACFDYLPSFGVNVLPIGFLAIAGFVVVMAHTVWRYELAEVTASLAATRILETTHGYIVLTDVAGKIRVISDAAGALLGYSEEELVGKPMTLIASEVAYLPPEGSREAIWLTRNGEAINVRVSATPITDSRGREIGSLYNAEDISRRKKDDALRESESKYRTLIENMNEGVMLVDREGIIQFVNQRMAQMLGYLPSEVVGKSANSFVDNTRSREGDRAIQLRTLRGRDLWAEVSEAQQLDAKGNVVGTIRVHTDITEKRRAELALRESEARYRLLAEHATDMISRHTPDGRFLYASPASRVLLGYGPEELVGTRSAELVHPEDRSALDSSRSAVLSSGTAAALTFRMRRKDGTFVPVETTWRPIRQQISGPVTEIVAVSRDISERKRAEQQIEYQAYHDVVTGLPNRTLVQDRFTLAQAHARRRQTRGQPAFLSVLFIDLDSFESLRSTLGHNRVDWLLQLIGQRFRESLRAEDTVARHGNEQFIVLLPHLDDAQHAGIVAAKLLATFDRPVQVGDEDLRVTASIGIASSPNDGDAFDVLVHNAELAMYRARTAGANSYQFSSLVNDVGAHRS